MKISKLKAIPIAICCFVMALWSETQGMENQSDILESVTVNRTTNMLPSSQNEIDDLSSNSLPLRLANLEDSTESCTSYLISSVKTVANEFTIVMGNNPKLAIVMAMTYLFPVVTMACDCYCKGPGVPCFNPPSTPPCGIRSDAIACAIGCREAGWNFSSCR